MELSTQLVERLIEPLQGETITDTASEYGEPGYGTYTRNGPILFGSWWCRTCDKADGLHDVQSHHPRFWAQLESQGYEFEWYDEWWVDYETSKAYRTQADSYHWQSSIQWNEDICNFLTPDHDDSDWIEWAMNDPDRCLMARFRHLEGWTLLEDRLENGWHQGMDDKPADAVKHVPDGYDYVFVLDETSQFYITFSLYIKEQEDADL